MLEQIDIPALIGGMAGLCTTLAFIPQVIKTYRTKSTGDLSLAMFLIFCIGVSLWLVYGIIKNDIPLIAANAVTLVLAGYILWVKLTPVLFRLRPY